MLGYVDTLSLRSPTFATEESREDGAREFCGLVLERDFPSEGTSPCQEH